MTTDDAAPGALPQWERKRARCKCAKIHTHAAAAAFVLTHVGRGGTNRSTVRLASVCREVTCSRRLPVESCRQQWQWRAFAGSSPFDCCPMLCRRLQLTLHKEHASSAAVPEDDVARQAQAPKKKKGINRTGREAVAAAKPRCLRKVAGLPSSHMTRPSHSQRNHPGYGCLRACLGGQRAGTARHWACPPIASTASTATGPPKRDDDNDDDASSSSHARIRARASPLTSKMLPGERQSFFLRLQKM